MNPALPSLSLRDRAVASDRDAVRRIVTSTGFFTPEEIDVAVELVDERLAKGPASGYDFVFAESQGSMTGYACYGRIACTDVSYDLYWVAVEQAAQGQGLGRALVREVESRIRRSGGGRVYIETSSQPKYAPTRAFYERCGYQVEARLADFYRSGDDKVVYLKVL